MAQQLNVDTSIVDLLKSKGQDSSYAARSVLAKNSGIANYTGTADQNIKLMGIVRGMGSPAAPAVPASPAAPTSPALPSPLSVTSPDSPITSSTPIRTENAIVQNDATKLLPSINSADSFMNDQFNSIMNAKAYGDTPEGAAKLAELDTIRKNLGILTPDQEAQAAAAGRAEGLKYDPLIADATTEKNLGLPKAVISGGERGGFMNTQVAGAAALQTTNGNSFIGAGGELENIKSAYDKNISDLQTKKQQAIAAATAAARQAMISGNAANLEAASKLFEQAKAAHEDSIALAKEKVDAISKYQQVKDARIQYNLQQLDQISQVGGAVPSDLSASLDSVYGSGFTSKYSAASAAAKAASTKDKQLDAFKKITDILKSYPAGQSLNIGGSTYTAIGDTKDNQTFKEEDPSGNVTFVTVDKGTGKIISSASGGRIGMGRAPKGGSGSGGGLPSGASAQLQAIKAKLDAAKGADGKTNPAVYGDQKAIFTAAYPAQAAKFDDYFPPDSYLNPSDKTAVPYFGTKPSNKDLNGDGSGGVTYTLPDGTTIDL